LADWVLVVAWPDRGSKSIFILRPSLLTVTSQNPSSNSTSVIAPPGSALNGFEISEGLVFLEAVFFLRRKMRAFKKMPMRSARRSPVHAKGDQP